MESYEIRWRHSAGKDLRNIDPQKVPRIIAAVESLVEHPLPRQCRKLQGSEWDNRVRVGDYRVIYHVDTESKVVMIFHIRRRREAYRNR